MSNLPTVKQLQYLVVLEQHLHFGKSATACNVTQSAFSIAIKELETTLNISLVDRTNRSVVFTAIGKRVVEHSRNILQQLDNIVDITRAAQTPLTGELKLGVIPTIAPFIMPALAPALRKKFPANELIVWEEKTPLLHKLLLEGKLDLLLLALPHDLINSETYVIFSEPFRLAYHTDTSLVSPGTFSPETIANESILLLDDGHCMRDHALSACDIDAAEKISKFTAYGLHSLIEMVNQDLGVTFVPQMAIDSGLLKNTQITTEALPDNPTREIGLAWRKGSARDSEFLLLAEVIRESLNK